MYVCLYLQWHLQLHASLFGVFYSCVFMPAVASAITRVFVWCLLFVCTCVFMPAVACIHVRVFVWFPIFVRVCKCACNSLYTFLCLHLLFYIRVCVRACEVFVSRINYCCLIGGEDSVTYRTHTLTLTWAHANLHMHAHTDTHTCAPVHTYIHTTPANVSDSPPSRKLNLSPILLLT